MPGFRGEWSHNLQYWVQYPDMNIGRVLRILLWMGVAAAGAVALATIAFRRGEPISGMWLEVAALCTYALGYRFYSRFIACKVLLLDSRRATPAERLDDGRDFVPTNKWVVFGHYFAARAGPGPVVAPVLAAQLGCVAGTIWILAGAVLGGCVQHFVIRAFSGRRDGKALGQMPRGGIGTLVGTLAFLAAIGVVVI